MSLCVIHPAYAGITLSFKGDPAMVTNQDVLNVLYYVNELDVVHPKDGPIRFTFLWHQIMRDSIKLKTPSSAKMLLFWVDELETYLKGYIPPELKEFHQTYLDCRKELKANLEGIRDSAMGASLVASSEPVGKK